MKNILIVISVFILIGCGKKPTANFTWSPKSPKAGETVVFTNTSTDAKKYDWNLGNMKISSEDSPQTVYDLPGDYIIDLTARNGTKKHTKTITLTVTP